MTEQYLQASLVKKKEDRIEQLHVRRNSYIRPIHAANKPHVHYNPNREANSVLSQWDMTAPGDLWDLEALPIFLKFDIEI